MAEGKVYVDAGLSSLSRFHERLVGAAGDKIECQAWLCLGSCHARESVGTASGYSSLSGGFAGRGVAQVQGVAAEDGQGPDGVSDTCFLPMPDSR